MQLSFFETAAASAVALPGIPQGPTTSKTLRATTEADDGKPVSAASLPPPPSEGGTLLVVGADVVVGADGLRSAVRRMRDERIEAQRQKANSKKTSAAAALHPAAAAAPVCASTTAAAASAASASVPAPAASGAPAAPAALYPTLQYTSPLRYIGVSVILGLTAAEHPLIHQVWMGGEFGVVWGSIRCGWGTSVEL